MHNAQMINDNYIILTNSEIKKRYPILFLEVLEHDKSIRSSWYELSDEAYQEYQKYLASIN